MKKWIVTGVAVATALNLWAQAPEMFRYQGRLVDGTNLVNATLPMSFKLYDAASDGTLLYEDSSSVLVVDGLYSTMIGDNTVFGSLSNALTNAAVYLELTVNGATLSPRERLVSVPYALNAGGDTNPAGTVVLSETHPNPELEASGFSAIRTTPGQTWTTKDRHPASSYDHEGSKCFSFKGKLWSIDKTYAGGNWSLSVWVSENGSGWDLATDDIGTDFPYGFSVTVFDNKMWVLGGVDNTGNYFESDEVWSSPDGTNWTLATDNPGWSPRFRSAVAVYEEKMWIIGGLAHDSSSGSTYFDDVWQSPDGTNWTLVTDNASWGSLYGHAAIAFQNKLWAIGGRGNNSDAWCTTNGVDWIQATTNIISAWQISACVLDDTLFIASDGSYPIYMSTNGVSWKVAGVTTWTQNAIGLVEHNDALWSFDTMVSYSTAIKKDSGLYYYRKD